MASKAINFLLFVIAFSLIVGDAEAGWKFWKKKNKDETTTTTLAPDVAGNPQHIGSENSGSGSGSANLAPVANNNGPPSSTSGNVNSRNSATPTTGTRGAIAGAANPGLAVGVGTTGENIRANARPQRPNPGTEVGLDISGTRAPARPGTGEKNGQRYRDWAADLTGAGEAPARQPAPKLPSSGPALTIQDPARQQPGSRPASPATSLPAVGKQQPAPGGIGQQQPASQTGIDSQTPGNTGARRPGSVAPPAGGGVEREKQQLNVVPAKENSQGSGISDDTHVSTLNIGSLNPGQRRPASPSSGYASPGSEGPGSPIGSGGASPTGGGKTWAQVAGNGGKSTSGSPTLSPGSVNPQPARPGQATPGVSRPATGQTQITSGGGSRGQSAAAVGGAAAIAGGAAAVARPTGAKVYSSNPTYSKGNTVTDEDLEKLAEALFIKDNNNANRYITVNLQKQTTGSSTADQAPQPLLTVNPEALAIPTIAKVITMYDNYKLDTRVNEYISPAQRQEESLLVDTFLSTNVMSAAMRFLADKGFLPKDYYAYKDTLRRLWFNLYSRGDGKIGSAGFEHVFLTELKLGTEVSGLHNWIYFNAEEVARRADYLGYIKKLDLGDKASIIKFHAKFNNIDKPVTTMFIGTSPELEMALYTVCFFARPERPCPLSLGGTKFNVVTHKFKYRGKELIGSAYPEI